MHKFLVALPVFFILSSQSVQSDPPNPVQVPSPASTNTGELQVSIVVVDELTPKPVPFTNFEITNTSDPNSRQTVKTDEQGHLEVILAPGDYSVVISKALEFKGHSYIWKGDAKITPGGVTKINWSDADAVTEIARPARQVSDEAAIYKLRKSGVVTVEGDQGSGSGFVVDAQGLILTNAHVVSGGRWAAVRFEPGVRVPATIVDSDKAADIAVLRVNPEAYKNFTVVPVADVSDGPVAVEGEKVLTIGSPLNQEKILTIGIVSKVEKDYLVSDININHGNSGGPLLNMAGDAIGLTTFLDSAQNGPGISGIVSISKALPVLARARGEVSRSQMPAAELLPDISSVPIPEEALTAYKPNDVKPYTEGKPKNFETIFATPFTIAAQQTEYDKGLNKDREKRLNKRGKDSDKDDLKPAPSAFWERYALHSADPVVWVIVRPALKQKAGNVWAGVLGASAGVAVRKEMEFRDDFYDMALYRGDTLVHPVRRFREKVSALYEGFDAHVNDNAYGGIYFYDPSDFAPGEKLTLYVRRESNLDRWDVVPVREEEQAKIYRMFLPYRSALAQVQGDGASTTVQGLSASVHTPPVGSADWEPDAAETASAQTAFPVSPAVTGGNPPAVKAASVRASAPPASVPHTTPAQVAPPSLTVTSPAPRIPVIKALPQRVRLEMTNGNSYFGTVTAFDGKNYTVTTDTGVQTINQADVQTLELVNN